ncbi:DNA-binding response regulator [Phormidium tenue FACHB-886]|nr:DNA-binding response regulator [Phormidium tenue FACHB-886]
MEGETVKKILVIENEAHTRNLFLEGLQAEGFSTISAENGRVGIEQAHKHLPDAIVCAILIPELSGYEVLTELRQSPATAVIPFIFVTTKVDWADLRKAMELGAADYLTKPCTLQALVGAISTQLKKQTVLRQWYTGQSCNITESGVDASPAASPELSESSITQKPGLLKSDPQLSKIFCFIEANYRRPIALSDVAQAVGYSPAYLTSLTKRLTGQTIQQWIIERRMVEARILLLETDQLVEQIAAQVGYHHPVHFFRQFRQIHGTTPSAWRNANRQLPGSANSKELVALSTKSLFNSEA